MGKPQSRNAKKPKCRGCGGPTRPDETSCDLCWNTLQGLDLDIEEVTEPSVDLDDWSDEYARQEGLSGMLSCREVFRPTYERLMGGTDVQSR